MRLLVATRTLGAVLALSDTGATHYDVKPASIIMRLEKLDGNWGARELQAQPVNQLPGLLEGLEAALGDNDDTTLPAAAGYTSRTGLGTMAYFTPLQWDTHLRGHLKVHRNRVRRHGQRTHVRL